MFEFLKKSSSGSKKITKEMTVAEIIRMFPGAATSFRKFGIEFIGKDLSPLEPLDKVAYGNGLNDESLEKMVDEINENMNQKPVEIVGENFINLSEKAVKEFKKLLAKKIRKKGIRLRLVSSGCALYVYDMEFASKRFGDEIEFETNGIKFFVQKKTIPLIDGVKIDFIHREGGFRFDNPHVEKDDDSKLKVL